MDAKGVQQIFDWLWSSGQLSAQDIALLPELGIKVVVNLALPTSSNALPGEAELVARQGIAYMHIPVSWEQPEIYRLRQFFGLLKAFEGQKVWVHCAMNMRASTFIYLYRRICLKEREEEAILPLQAVWEPNETWRSFIQNALGMEL